MNRISRRGFGIMTLAAMFALPMSVSAQDAYPSRPIHILLGVAPAGLQDVTARLLVSYLAPRLGKSIVVENRPGANTTIGANDVLKAAPDGYTLFYGSAMSPSPIFVKNGAIDFATQMKPVAMIASSPWYLLINSKVPAKTMDELIAYSKQHPGKLNFADGAPLSTMVMSAIAQRTGLSYTPIPYKGSAPSLTALISGEVDMVLDTVPNYLPHIKAGKVVALMNTGSARTPALPDVPAGAEVKGMNVSVSSVQSLWAPPGTPDAIIERLNREIATVVANPEFRAKFRAAAQVDPVSSTPVELLKSVESDKTLLTAIAKRIGYQPR